MHPPKRRKNAPNKGLVITCIALAALLLILVVVLLVVTLSGGKEDADSSPSSSLPSSAAVVSTPEPLPPVSLPESQPVVSLPASSVSISLSEPEPEPQPPPEFTAAPAVAVSGNVVTITYKTNVDSTVNAILTTSGENVGLVAFYDYYNRSKALDGAVDKKTTYNVGSGGKTETFVLPDLSRPYYLLLNGVENVTDVWQKSVTVVAVFDPATSATGFAKTPVLATGQPGTVAVSVETYGPCTVYAIVTQAGATAPTAQQVREGGAGYTGGTVFGGPYALIVPGDKTPYAATLGISTEGMSGGFTVWLVAQNSGVDGAPFSGVVSVQFTV